MFKRRVLQKQEQILLEWLRVERGGDDDLEKCLERKGKRKEVAKKFEDDRILPFEERQRKWPRGS